MGMNMNEMLRKALSLGVGVTMASKERIESFVDEMVKRGELAPADSKEWIASLVEKGETERQEWAGYVKEQMQKLLAELQVASKEDIARLERRIAALEAQQNPTAAPAAAVQQSAWTNPEAPGGNPIPPSTP